MNDFKVYKTIHFPDEWAEQITLMHQKQWNTNKGSYMYYNVRHMNLDSKHNFYIFGILNDKVIASCFVSSYANYELDEPIEKNDEYLISSLIVDKDYQKQGYGTSFIKSVITILKEENVVKVVAFACDNSKRLFEKLGFIKDESVTSFGSTYPGDDDADPKYSEHSVSLEFYLDENYLFKSAIFKMVDEAINYYKEKKENNNLEHIKVCLNKYTILMKRYDFYKRCLLELGFEQKDKETFILKIK